MIRAACILPAAGSGRRMGMATPKPFLLIDGCPALAHGLSRLRSAFPFQSASGEEITLAGAVVVLPPGQIKDLSAAHGEWLSEYGATKLVAGADTRQKSVANGLAALEDNIDLVLVHDAARPFITPRLTRALCLAAIEHGGALPALPLTDTVKRLEPGNAGMADGIYGLLGETVPRAGLYAVQTPQVFQYSLLKKAYDHAGSLGEEITDDAMVVAAAGGKVAAVEGDRHNLKLTSPDDLRLAEALIASGLVQRIG